MRWGAVRYWLPFVVASLALHALLSFTRFPDPVPDRIPAVRIANVHIVRVAPAPSSLPIEQPRAQSIAAIARAIPRVRLPRPVVTAIVRPARLLAIDMARTTPRLSETVVSQPAILPTEVPSVESSLLDTPPPPAPTPSASPGTVDAVSLTGWSNAIGDRLNRLKRYPEASRVRLQQGLVLVDVTLLPDGRVIAATVAQSSTWAALDTEAVALVWRANPLPPPPVAYAKGRTSIVVRVPVSFTL